MLLTISRPLLESHFQILHAYKSSKVLYRLFIWKALLWWQKLFKCSQIWYALIPYSLTIDMYSHLWDEDHLCVEDTIIIITYEHEAGSIALTS